MQNSSLLFDLYELTMAQAYWTAGHAGRGSFSLFIRKYPPKRAYYMASGIEVALRYLEQFRFTKPEIDALKGLDKFDAGFLDFLAELRFTGDVRSVREGTVVFANEPILEVDAPIIEGQLIETAMLNMITTHTNLTTKGTRMVTAAGDRAVVDFAARRTQGPSAAFIAARSGWLAGFAGTSHVGAAQELGIPAVGTMAHSFIQSYEREVAAFRAYAAAFPDSTVLLVDTWDVEKGIENAITVGHELEKEGHRLTGIRIDSGDLGELSKMARAMLDAAGLDYVRITVSGGLDEYAVRDLLASGAPIDSFGIGSAFGVADDSPHIDSAYKLVEYEGRPVHKTSPGKKTLPGRKQVWRRSSETGTFIKDEIRYWDDSPVSSAEPLLQLTMRAGQRVDSKADSLDKARERSASQLGRVPAGVRGIEPTANYTVEVSGRLATDSSP